MKKQDKKRQREIDTLEREVDDLLNLSGVDNALALERLQRQVAELKRDFYAHLGAWQRLQLARHPQRPQTLDYIQLLFEDFIEIHGDRAFADDPAMVCGMA